jgi:phosphopantothenoylcysteine decarboxylase/phosphopantothenate--cysteine ligase
LDRARRGGDISANRSDRIVGAIFRAAVAGLSHAGGQAILLIIGGGIAAYKALDLIRRLKERRCASCPVLTRAAEEFVTPLSVSALAGEKVYRDLFDLTDEAEMGHIELSRAADLVVVAPATADLMAKMAGGHADDLASTLLMATDKRVLIAPAMNVRMWEHPATQRNLATLQGRRHPRRRAGRGRMACGEFGPGAWPRPGDHRRHRGGAGRRAAAGRHVLVTSGPDP